MFKTLLFSLCLLSSAQASISCANLTNDKQSAVSSDGVRTSPIRVLANNLVLMNVVNTSNDIPTIEGASVTWIQINTVNIINTFRITTFRGLINSIQGGRLTISFGGNSQSNVLWAVDECSGIDFTGDNGSGAIAQSVINHNNTDAFSVNLTALGSDKNVNYGATASSSNSVVIGDGYSQLSNDNDAINNLTLQTQYKLSSDTNVNWTGITANWAGIGLELKVEPSTNIRRGFTLTGMGH